MKIVVVSDTHLETVTDELKQICREYFAKADLVIHLGDWNSIEVYKFFQQYPLIGLAGNADPLPLKKLLPYKKIIKIGKYRIGMIHGSGASFDLTRRIRREFMDVDIIFFGHTHEPYQSKEGNLFLLNPGSLLWGKGHVERSFAIVKLGERIESDIIML